MSDFVDRLLGRTDAAPVRPLLPSLFEPVTPLGADEPVAPAPIVMPRPVPEALPAEIEAMPVQPPRHEPEHTPEPPVRVENHETPAVPEPAAPAVHVQVVLEPSDERPGTVDPQPVAPPLLADGQPATRPAVRLPVVPAAEAPAPSPAHRPETSRPESESPVQPGIPASRPAPVEPAPAREHVVVPMALRIPAPARQEHVVTPEARRTPVPVGQEQAPVPAPLRHEHPVTPVVPRIPAPQKPVAPVSTSDSIVHITIGRLEVKATAEPAPPEPRSPKRRQALGLDEYLRRKAGGS